MSDLGIYTERQVKQMRDRLIELLQRASIEAEAALTCRKSRQDEKEG